MDNRTLARGKAGTAKAVARFETHTFPNSRRRFLVTRKGGKIVSMVHIATVSDPTASERW
jgi:hypothetical protein